MLHIIHMSDGYLYQSIVAFCWYVFKYHPTKMSEDTSCIHNSTQARMTTGF